MKETILLLLTTKGSGPFFSYQMLGAEFNKLGYKTRFIECFSSSFEEELKEAFRTEKVAFVLSHNNLKVNYKIDGEYFYDKYNCVYIALIDTPLNKFHLFADSGKNVVFLLADRSFQDLVQPVIPGKSLVEWHGFNNVFFEGKVPPYPERKIDILFAGRIGNEASRIRKQTSAQRALGKRIISRYTFQYEKQIHHLMKEEVEAMFFWKRPFYRRFLEANTDNWNYYWDVVHQMRTRRRNFVLKELFSLPPHINITLITDKENAKELRQTVGNNVTVHDFMPWPDVIRIMQQSKITINIIPYHLFNHHERIATAQYSGSVVLSDRNKYLATAYEHEKDILFYEYKKGELSSMILHYLPQVELMTGIAEKARAKVLAHHMPFNRARFILDCYAEKKKNI